MNESTATQAPASPARLAPVATATPSTGVPTESELYALHAAVLAAASAREAATLAWGEAVRAHEAGHPGRASAFRAMQDAESAHGFAYLAYRREYKRRAAAMAPVAPYVHTGFEAGAL